VEEIYREEWSHLPSFKEMISKELEFTTEDAGHIPTQEQVSVHFL
jgi:hypothetical protein